MSILEKIQLKRGVALPSGSLSTIRLIDIALKNLFYKKLRTTLTIAGVVVGIGAVCFLLAFGFGLRDVVTRQVVDSNSVRTIDVTPAKANLVTLNSENIKRIERTPGVALAAPAYYYAGNVSYQNAKTEAVVYGSGQKYLDLISFKRVAGNLPNFTKNPKSVFVSSAYAQTIGIKDPQQLVGKELTIAARVAVVSETGITQKALAYKGEVGGVVDTGSGAEVYMNEGAFLNAGITTASQLKVLAQDKKDVPNIQQKIEALGFISSSPLQTLQQINQIFGVLNILFLGFGGIGLIIAVLGMFNTLTISLLERTKEIGLMVALGARNRDVRRLFIVEAVGLAVIGGAIGILGAYGMSLLINYVLNHLAQGRGVTEGLDIFSFPAWLLLTVMVFSAVLGLVVVYIPARRAGRINPIEALKS